MATQKLVLKYHPAKKEVGFQRFQNGKEIAIRTDSKLMQYMKMKGKFILQDFGNSFFDDIAKAFDGLKSLEIEVITTRLDYEDFVQMVEYYNEGSNCKCKMFSKLAVELPDMNQTFEKVVKHGDEAIAMLENHRRKLFDIPLENDNVRRTVESFSRQISDEIENIEEKISSLKDNNVSLCFAGVYSAGKSALINAFLGYRILPEDIKSETAKTFQITSPQNQEPVKIICEITNVYTEIVWNNRSRCFEFIQGPSENPTRKDIQTVMNDVRNKEQYEQLREILSKLNGCPEISELIKIKFPVPLDSDKVQFTIFDTPGTDSNYAVHQNVLLEALEGQRKSILVFVARPDGLEGAGNNALLNYLNEADKKSKTTIDMGRSLFVINKADGQSAGDRETLRYQEIRMKDGNEVTAIKLSDKKLFFTSARYAYAAKAVANGSAGEEDRGIFEAGKSLLTVEAVPMGHCYRQNRCAASEIATDKMLQTSEEALEKAQKENDKCKELVICSGLYALENEIRIYGEKYASAVKAFAIIDSVDKALSKLTNQADSLKDSAQAEVSDIERNIKELRETITGAIDTAYSEVSISSKDRLSEETIERLNLDKVTIKTTTAGKVVNYLDNELEGRFFGMGKVKFRDTDKEMVVDKINQVMKEFTNNFSEQRKKLLEESRNSFMNSVRRAIINNGNISESAKKEFLDIPAPKIPELDFAKLGNIYDKHKTVERFLCFQQESLDKEEFLQDIEGGIVEVVNRMKEDYIKDYCKALNELLEKIKERFVNNLDTYSVRIQALKENREVMNKLADKISAAAGSLRGCQHTLNKVIWMEVVNV